VIDSDEEDGPRPPVRRRFEIDEDDSHIPRGRPLRFEDCETEQEMLDLVDYLFARQSFGAARI